MHKGTAIDFQAICKKIFEQHNTDIRLTADLTYGPQRLLRFELANGLRLILAPKPHSEVFTYQTWFAVGSKNEDPQRTGLAHLFEHLMFKGTKNFATGVFDKDMESRGAQTNAATWVDWTYYTQSLANRDDNLQAIVTFEADRMQHLLLDEQTFASELEVVKNERRLSVDDNIAGYMAEELFALAYQQHAYRWPTIGSMVHLEQSSIKDLEIFYRNFYAPNNAVVVIVGGFDAEQAMTCIAKAYGGIAKVAIKRPQIPQEAIQTKPRQKTISKNVVMPQLLVAYKTVPEIHEDFVALEMLCDILTSGEISRLYQRLVVKDNLCNDVSGFVLPFAETGLLELHMTLRPQANVSDVLAILEEELVGLQQNISDIEKNKACAGLEIALLDHLKENEGLAEALGHHEINHRDCSRVFTALERYEQLSLTDLQEAAGRYLNSQQQSAVILLPEDTNHGG